MEMLQLFLIVLVALATGECHKRQHGLKPPSLLTRTPLPEALWFDQKLDHYKPTDLRTWKQRYYVNDKFFKAKSKDAPVFLMIGGEGEASANWMVTGAWIEYAEVFGALCFQLEHRFYGMSRPTKDISVESLAFLNSEQALADLANFIVSMNAQYGLVNNKWVAFGGSYPGSLAAWLRYKYPHLVHAAISSSGPLLAVADFKEYIEVVKDSLKTSSDECVNQVKMANKHLTKLFGDESGGSLLTKKFRLCSSLNVSNELDKANLAEALSDHIISVVQYNKITTVKTTNSTSHVTIDDVCSIMTDSKFGDAIDRYAELNRFMMDLKNQTCLKFSYNNAIEETRNITWSSGPSDTGRQWLYQTCVEFGFYQTSSSESELFGPNFPLDFYIQLCKDIYGEGFGYELLEQGINRTNTMYGGLHLKVKRVVFVHGSIDPWHALGIISSKNPDAPAIYIKGTAHCANMYSSRESDLPQLKKARKLIVHYLQKWLKENDY